MRQVVVRVLATAIVALVGIPYNANAVVVSEACFNGFPPPGFVGPNPTGICIMTWGPGGSAVEVRHRSRIFVLDPPVGLTDDDTWTSFVDPASTGAHTWVLQTVCVLNPPAVVDMLGDASAFRFPPFFPFVPILDNRSESTTGGSYANTCVLP
jgi:hypothetical protein